MAIEASGHRAARRPAPISRPRARIAHGKLGPLWSGARGERMRRSHPSRLRRPVSAEAELLACERANRCKAALAASPQLKPLTGANWATLQGRTRFYFQLLGANNGNNNKEIKLKSTVGMKIASRPPPNEMRPPASAAHLSEGLAPRASVFVGADGSQTKAPNINSFRSSQSLPASKPLELGRGFPAASACASRER